MAVGDRISETVGTGIGGVRRIGDGAVRVVDRDRAMRGLGDAVHAQRIAVQVRIVGKHVQGYSGIFVQGGAIIDRHRIDVLGIDAGSRIAAATG